MDALVGLALGGAAIYAATAVIQNLRRRARAAAFRAAVNERFSALLQGEGKAQIPVLDASHFAYRPVSNERLLGVHERVARVALRNSGRYVSSGLSFSVPIVKGVRYRVGSGERRSEKTWQTLSVGRLLVTDKAIVFEGDGGNERITWNQVAHVESMLDGIEVSKRSGSPRTFRIQAFDPAFAVTIEIMRRAIEVIPPSEQSPGPPPLPTLRPLEANVADKAPLRWLRAGAALAVLLVVGGAAFVVLVASSLRDESRQDHIANRESSIGWQTSVTTSSTTRVGDDDIAAFVAKFGPPDSDLSKNLQRPGQTILTRRLLYKKQRVLAVFVPDAQDASPPYRAWKLLDFRDGDTIRILEEEEVVRRFSQGRHTPPR